MRLRREETQRGNFYQLQTMNNAKADTVRSILRPLFPFPENDRHDRNGRESIEFRKWKLYVARLNLRFILLFVVY